MSANDIKCIWARSQNCGCLVTWFCYQLIAKPGNKTDAVSWPDLYTLYIFLQEDSAGLTWEPLWMPIHFDVSLWRKPCSSDLSTNIKFTGLISVCHAVIESGHHWFNQQLVTYQGSTIQKRDMSSCVHSFPSSYLNQSLLPGAFWGSLV